MDDGLKNSKCLHMCRTVRLIEYSALCKSYLLNKETIDPGFTYPNYLIALCL